MESSRELLHLASKIKIFMRVEQHFDLYSHNTMKLHSIAERVYFPESCSELRYIIDKYPDAILLAAGSNVILPAQLQRTVVSLMSLDNSLEVTEDGCVNVGCSVRIQKLIRFLQEHNMGGIEYLYSIPASVGGLVYMNGGRGKSMNMAISDFLESVEYLDLNDMEIKTYTAERSDFSYRHSPFQDMNVIILSATFKFKGQEPEVTEQLIKERLDYSKKYLSADKPSCGTAFCKGNKYIFRLMRGMRVGGAMFSKKTSNWISNVDNATYEDVCKLIKRAQKIHKLFFGSCEPEIRIIKE